MLKGEQVDALWGMMIALHEVAGVKLESPGKENRKDSRLPTVQGGGHIGQGVISATIHCRWCRTEIRIRFEVKNGGSFKEVLRRPAQGGGPVEKWVYIDSRPDRCKFQKAGGQNMNIGSHFGESKQQYFGGRGGGGFVWARMALLDQTVNER